MTTNKYLEKVALRRSVVEFAKGNISKSVEELSRLGVFKSKKTYTEGMKVGNAALARKSDAIVQHAKNPAHKLISSIGGGYVTTAPNKNGSIHILVDRKSALASDEAVHQGLIRHELIEADSVRKAAPKVHHHNLDVTNHLIEAGLSHKHSIATNKSIPKTAIPWSVIQNHIHPVGKHQTPSVLSRESEEVRKNPYLKETFTAIRNMTGEKPWVERVTGKSYGAAKMGRSSHRKMDRVPHSSIASDPMLPDVHNKVYQIE